MRLLEREIPSVGKPPIASPTIMLIGHAKAPLLDLLGAVIDHIEAHSSGGADQPDNLTTACNKCNGRKSAATLDKWGERPMEKPIKGKYGEPQRWDGFSTLFVVLARRNLDALTTTEKGWLKALS